jgi:hypothetical protein
MTRRDHDAAQAFNEAWDGRARRARTSLDTELAELVACAEQICEAAVAEPSAEFRSALRTQLMTEAATVLAPAHSPQHTHRPPVRTPSYGVRRRLAGLTAAVVTAGGFVGMVGASAQALPGEMLYPVKRGVENVELAFHKDDLSRGEYRLTQASERLAEARRLTEDGSPQAREHVAGALDDFAEQAKAGSGSLFRAYGQNGSVQSITTVNDFSAAAAADLAQLSGNMPSDADQSFQDAASTVSELVSQASNLCTSCSTANITGLVGAVTSLGGGGSAGPTSAPTAAANSGGNNGDSGNKLLPTPDITVPSLPINEAPGPSSASTNAPKVKDLTDPLVGSLLGDDDQPGVVPNLLDGLIAPNH